MEQIKLILSNIKTNKNNVLVQDIENLSEKKFSNFRRTKSAKETIEVLEKQEKLDYKQIIIGRGKTKTIHYLLAIDFIYYSFPELKIELYSFNPTQIKKSQNQFFHSDLHELAFYINLHDTNFLEVANKKLNIKRLHYVDKKRAKEWRNNLLKTFHPDKNQNNLFDYDEITQNINNIYTRMIGES
jgi:hypothetical protein